MSTRDRYQGRARSRGYVPPRPSFTPEQRLEECYRIADRIENGQATPVDEIALKAHLRVLTGRGLVQYEEDAIARAAAADEPGETP